VKIHKNDAKEKQLSELSGDMLPVSYKLYPGRKVLNETYESVN